MIFFVFYKAFIQLQIEFQINNVKLNRATNLIIQHDWTKMFNNYIEQKLKNNTKSF